MKSWHGSGPRRRGSCCRVVLVDNLGWERIACPSPKSCCVPIVTTRRRSTRGVGAAYRARKRRGGGVHWMRASTSSLQALGLWKGATSARHPVERGSRIVDALRSGLHPAKSWQLENVGGHGDRSTCQRLRDARRSKRSAHPVRSGAKQQGRRRRRGVSFQFHKIWTPPCEDEVAACWASRWCAGQCSASGSDLQKSRAGPVARGGVTIGRRAARARRDSAAWRCLASILLVPRTTPSSIHRTSEGLHAIVAGRRRLFA